MGFGISFGKKKQSSTTNSTLTKAEDTFSSGLESQNQTQTSSTSGSTQTSGSTTGSGSTTQEQNLSGTAESQSQTSGTVKSFSDQLSGGLEAAISQLLGGANDRNTIESGIAKVNSFDADSYVANTVGSARALEEDKLGEQLAGVIDAIGGNNNSAALLLQQRMANQSGANLAGIEAQARANAAGIQQGALGASAGALGTLNQLAAQLTTALKGGNVESTGTAIESQQTGQTGTTTGTSQTSEQTSQNQQTQQNTTSQLIGLISQLLSSSTDTVATEDSKTKGKSAGGGISLSI